MHGKLPYIKYLAEITVEYLAHEVMKGKWGNGAERKRKLESAGYNYREVQDWQPHLQNHKDCRYFGSRGP